MKVKQLIFMSLLSSSLYAADNEQGRGPNEEPVVVQQAKEQELNVDHNADEETRVDVDKGLPVGGWMAKLKEKIPPIELTDEHRHALNNAGVIFAGLCTTFGNAVGRLFLMGFFTFKGCKNIRKLLSDNTQRSVHAGKALCYLVATALLAQDGYAWLLKQEQL